MTVAALRPQSIARLWAVYCSVSAVVFTTLLLFFALNVVIATILVFQKYVSAHSSPVAEKYGTSSLRLVYPGKSGEEIRDLLAETWSRPYLYEPFTQFKERPYRGHYVKVSDDGFRFSADQAPWPPGPTTFSIFVFGGSTTFGYGVGDHETIPSHLQVHLRERLGAEIAVFNFGRGFYYSSQERVLFQQLLARGYRPRLAIFIDGLNEFYYTEDEPVFTSGMRAAFLEPPLNTPLVEFVRTLPVARAARGIGRWIGGPSQSQAVAVSPDAVAVHNIIHRYLANKRMIESVAVAHGVSTLFVWQPVPTYKYDQVAHLFAGGGYGKHSLSAHGYRAMAAVPKASVEHNFLWCADIQEGRKEPLYVDLVHYTAAFGNEIAKCIAERALRMR